MWTRTGTWSLRALSTWAWRTRAAFHPVKRATRSPRLRAARTVIYGSIHALDPARWDALVGPHAITRTHAYLAAVEASAINDCKYFYPVLYDARDEMIAHACIYTITTDFVQILPRLLRGVGRAVQMLWPKFLQVKLTECASPLVVGRSISIRDDVESHAVLGELARVIGEIARSEGSSLTVIRDFLGAERDRYDSLLEAGYHRVSNKPLARIKVRWNSYDEYLSQMRARYRKDIKRRLQRASTDGQQIEILESFAANAGLWARQARVMYGNTKGIKREILSAAYYEHMDRALGERSKLLVAIRDGRQIAHGMVLLDGENTTATYFGRDAGPPCHAWFHLINEVIRLAIERKSAYINLGLGSYEAKALVGADVEPLYVYSKSTYAIVNWLMKLVPNRMEYPVKESKRIFHEV
ncbi:MAG: GNAT family N-acetyltransferase [Gammaproteobacteria bacterium]|nr:GNAT family N-acetyltransferase [Gammaproteobacteria bacterium]